jgi:hypothetical protein
LRDVEGPTFSLDNRLTDGGEVVSLTRRPPLTSRNIPGTHFFRGRVDPRTVVRLEGLDELKNPTTPSGVEAFNATKSTQCRSLCTA